MDAVAFLGSECVRINPGRANGSIEKSIASMKEVNQYAQQKKLILLTENHFGIEMNPELHLRIVQEAGPKNIYTLPDFGNYSQQARLDSLEKIMPYAYLISAKADGFNENMEHISYDFDKCVQLAERHGFKGIYSLEQWNSKYQNLDYEKVADWLIDHVTRNI
jgi:sugar phosphate isomerase/epimerase